MINAKGETLKNYALADLLGAHFEGQISFPPRPKVTVKADSEYSDAYGPRNLTDGLATGWTSGGTPMPHWVELSVKEAVDVYKIELVNRKGGFQIVDADIEAWQNNAWEVVASIRNAATPVLSIPLDKTVHVDKIRVKILKELFLGQDRSHADLEEIQGFGETAIRIKKHDSRTRRAFSDEAMIFSPMMVRVKPTTAKAIATLDDEEQTPLILRNRFGRGEALLVTTTEEAFSVAGNFWPGLVRLAIGQPTLRFQQAPGRRCRDLEAVQWSAA